MSELQCFIAVAPRAAEKEAAQVASVVDFSKATTLSYQLPDARTEIKRLDELHRSLEKDLLKFRPVQRTQQSVLSEWLKRNEDLSLVDVNLGDSDATIKQIAEEEVSGLGRYALRGDLRMWMDRVAVVDNNTAAVAGDWTAEDVKAIDGELREQVRRVVAADAGKRKTIHIDRIQRICEQLRFISDGRNFRIDPEFVTDDTQQLLRLSEYVDEWHSHIERHGHPHKQTEAEIARRIADAETKRRQMERGLAAAGRAAGFLLTDDQLDQVLTAFYEQRQPSTFLSKKEKDRIERNMVTTLRHCETLESTTSRALDASAAKTMALESEIVKLRQELEIERGDPKRRQTFVDGLEQANATVQTAAEVLSRKRIREAEDIAMTISNEFTILQHEFESSKQQLAILARENAELRDTVDCLSNQWKQLMALRSLHEEEMARLHGGRVSDLQRLMTTLSEVFASTFDTLNAVVQSFATLAPDSSALNSLLEPVHRWCASVIALPGTSEGVKSASRDLVSVMRDKSKTNPEVPLKQMPKSEDRDYIDLLVRRMDLAAAELQSHYREKRAMKNATAYFFQVVNAIAEGRYETVAGAGGRFPPSSVLGSDEPYLNAWADEIRGFERIVTLLRTELNDVSDKKAGSNALLRSIEVYGETVFASNASPVLETTQMVRAQVPKEALLLHQKLDVQQVSRDSRMLLSDRSENTQRMKPLSGVELLQSIADRRRESHTLPPLRSGLHLAEVKAAAEACRESKPPSPVLVPKTSQKQSADKQKTRRL